MHGHQTLLFLKILLQYLVVKIDLIDIKINGKKYSDYQEGITVQDLIEKLNLHDKQIIVELNQLALIKKDYQTQSLKDGDSIEIVQIAAGG